jgi:hypothetical protein
MVYNIWDYLIFRLPTPSDILKNTVFRKLDLFPSSGERVVDITVLNPLQLLHIQ